MSRIALVLGCGGTIGGAWMIAALHALTDLVKVLRPQSGTLFFHSAYRGRTLELTLLRGHLHGSPARVFRPRRGVG